MRWRQRKIFERMRISSYREEQDLRKGSWDPFLPSLPDLSHLPCPDYMMGAVSSSWHIPPSKTTTLQQRSTLPCEGFLEGDFIPSGYDFMVWCTLRQELEGCLIQAAWITQPPRAPLSNAHPAAAQGSGAQALKPDSLDWTLALPLTELLALWLWEVHLASS